MNRRSLIKSLGSVVGIAGVSSIASAHKGHYVYQDNDFLIIESGPGQLVTGEFAHHHHFLKIPMEIINKPHLYPNGVEISTEWANFRNPFARFALHYHSVYLSYEQLVLISQGQAVTVEDSVKDHKFICRLKA